MIAEDRGAEEEIWKDVASSAQRPSDKHFPDRSFLNSFH